MFVDEVEIRVEAGNGGDGCTALSKRKVCSNGRDHMEEMEGMDPILSFKVDEGLSYSSRLKIPKN